MLTREALDRLLETMTVEEIRATHGAQLDDDGHAYLDSFASFEEDLALLGESIRSSSPPHTAPDPDHFEGRRSRPWWRRPLAVPAWATLAAAVIVLAFLLIRPFGQESHPNRMNLKTLLGFQRGASEAPLDRFDQAVFQALVRRALHHMEGETRRDYELALTDLEAAYRINPRDRDVLRYLVLTCDNLGLKNRRNIYQKLLDNIIRGEFPLKGI